MGTGMPVTDRLPGKVQRTGIRFVTQIKSVPSPLTSIILWIEGPFSSESRRLRLWYKWKFVL